MNIQNRLLRIVYSRTDDTIIASDVRGRVHKFDADLNLLRSSPAGSGCLNRQRSIRPCGGERRCRTRSYSPAGLTWACSGTKAAAR